jgi:hypothetical protein
LTDFSPQQVRRQAHKGKNFRTQHTGLPPNAIAPTDKRADGIAGSKKPARFIKKPRR